MLCLQSEIHNSSVNAEDMGLIPNASVSVDQNSSSVMNVSIPWKSPATEFWR